MSFDEEIFARLVRKWNRWKSKSILHHQHIADLECLRLRLAQVGEALLGFAIDIAPEIDKERSYINRLVLPPAIFAFETKARNEQMYWYRLLFHFAACKLERHSKLSSAANIQNRVAEAQVASQSILKYLKESLPRFEKDYVFIKNFLADNRQGTSRQLAIWPQLPMPIIIQFPGTFHPSISCEEKRTSGGKEIKVRTENNPALIDSKQEEDQPLVHVFEKVLTADNYQGGSKSMDGSDESEAHQEALDELTLNAVMRTGRDTEVFLKSDVEIQNLTDYEASQSNEVCFRYPEWFSSENQYRQDWCSLRSFTHRQSGETYMADPEYQPQVIALKARLHEFFNRNLWQHRQKDGPEIDIDSVIRWRSLWRGSGVVDHRIYSKRKRVERDMAMMILMDTSLSTDSWTSNRRVLDELKAIADILSQALGDFSDYVSFATFSSQSRHQCEFGWFKQMNESWAVFRERMPSIKPTGYTRTGVAIRHAAEELLKLPGQSKGLILLTDGKPTDFDRYEGKHGRMDVHRAVEEAASKSIQFHSIVLSSQGSRALNEQFGRGRYQIMQTAKQISIACVDEFIQLCGSNRTIR
ncbi:MAG: hypothetical protein COV44_04445 [Deltaproteobacteria bacterium CG11_big_fil_rev_8_21_14_0_20_45_16]|nr:MAG: hypothetical protein COV44_04445 [Deltaproteobacteria bacterium CG11_big_fil_rev_8_21_14_0_20_45_16]